MKNKTTLSEWIDGKADFPEHIEGRDTFEKIKKYSAQLKAPDFDRSGVYEKIQKAKAKQSQKTKASYSFLFKLAAVFIIAFGILAIVHQMSWQTFQTALAENNSVVLPDNSQVLLQPGSELSYNSFSWFVTREVKLEGEAFFEVEKGETFSVITKAGQVDVLGTKFNVKSTDSKLNVVCYEGRVKVTQKQITEIINQNEFVILRDNTVLNKSKMVLSQLPTETDYFQIIDEEFEVLLKDVERYYNVKISTENIASDKHFTGKLPRTDMRKALDIIAKTFQLRYKSINENNFIFVDDVNQ
jgi:ferric-dicitrate binding protein FerR (iron transport regulator)